MLQEADIIFYVGEDLENFLEKPLKSIAKKAEKIELMEIKGLNKLKFRERNIFDGHDDHGHDEDGHKEDDHDDEHKHEEDGHKEDDHDDDHKHEEDGHKEDDHDDHKHEEDGHKEDDHDDHGHDEDGHEGHAHGEYDPHIWLDPENAKVILNEMVEHLIENDAKNASVYESNLKKVRV